jgi:FAD/FMN-containing dehydrogenase
MTEHGWRDSVLVWNGLVATVPALVVRPGSAQELAEAVAFAREHGLRVNVARGREGGVGGSVSERCLTLDLSNPP